MLDLIYADVSSLTARAKDTPLSAYRLERLKRVKTPQAKRQGLGAEILLIQALRRCSPETKLPLEIAVGENGKPYFPGKELRFSLSHSGEIALCALSNREVGADVERMRAFDENLSRRFFTEAEQEYISQAKDRAHAFTQVWTLKESYIKATGQGLRLPLNSFSVPVGAFAAENCDDWFFWHRSRDGFHFAACVKGSPAVPEFFEKISI